jgi:phage shock protein E
MKKSNVILFIMMVIAVISCNEANSQIANLPLAEFVKTYKDNPNAQLLDVRTPGEWSQGKLESSRLINCNDAKFEQNLSALDKSKPVFVYCAVGGRSSKAAQVLNKNGFKVYNLTGAGYGQLADKGL